MALKNYTTSISVEKTITEIETILAKHGATGIMKLYDKGGNPSSLAFKCLVNGNEIAFKLPMEEEKIVAVFKVAVSKGQIPRKYWGDTSQARRTGWRIIKDWVDSQMALLEINVVRMEQIFLPYMWDEQTQQTLFQKIEQRGFSMQLEDKRDKVFTPEVIDRD